MNITPELIRRLGYPGMPMDQVNVWAAKLGDACRLAQINTPQRIAHFLAQASHESGGFFYSHEIWGPTPAQLRYEGRLDLGNVRPGDGRRYAGRGPFQLTGRANYRTVGNHIGYPLEDQPELAAQIGVGSLVACDFWVTRFVSLNKIADRGGLSVVPAITRVINGGFNGLPDRQRRYSLAAHVLGL